MTFFAKKVLKVVAKIPRGKTLSYKEVARRAGRPTAWRAVGNILNKNQNPKISCHRVIKSSGEVGGYNKGNKEKLKRLQKEGVF
ncbi:MAG: MGMT family protein [Candidatus Paceibacterota bacterium]